jgi:hypothetical protein
MTTEETTNRTVKLWDIRDLNNITLTGQYLAANNLAHNTHIKGDLAIISHYSYGVAVVDISTPDNPVELGRYDTFPLSDNPGFFGCWGAYPFTSKGHVYTSDIEGYLTVLRLVETSTSVDNPDQTLPERFAISQNYPNPFNPSTTLSYNLPKTAKVNLTIYNLLGKEMITLVSETQTAGEKSVVWDGRDSFGKQVSSGVYIFRLKAGEFVKTMKMVLLK